MKTITKMKVLALIGLVFSAHLADAQNWLTGGNGLTGGTSATPNEWIGSNNTYDWVVKTTNTERMRIQAAGNVGINTNAPLCKFNVKNGAVLFDGTTGAVPTAGAGTRLMWVPASSAFRAGGVAGTEWDSPGTYSFATGLSTIASGNYTAATGYYTTASGTATFATGGSTVAQAYCSAVVGAYNLNPGTYSTGTFVGTDPMFIVGNGQSSGARSNAMTVLKDGGVGVGTTTPTGLIHSYNTAASVYVTSGRFDLLGTTNSTNNWGVYGYITAASGLPTNTAVSGIAEGDCNASGGDVAFGVYGKASLAITNYGVYGIATTAGCNNSTGYAGYFNGNVVYTGTLNGVSDQKFKENIAPIKNALEIMKALKPSKYNYTKEEAYKSMNLASGEQYGFIAQELEKVIPQLVGDNVNPAQFDKDGKKIAEEVKYKGVNYISLIPFTVAAINEQQKMIEEQKTEIENLQNQLAAIAATPTTMGSAGTIGASTEGIVKEGAVLYQNTPNPFSQQTNIQYFIPVNAKSASIMIFDLNGRPISTVAVTSFGKNAVTINGNQLEPGMYVYSLVVDDKIIDTKRMILTK